MGNHRPKAEECCYYTINPLFCDFATSRGNPRRCIPRYSRNETSNSYQNLENPAVCFQPNEAIYSAGCNLLRIFIDQLVRYGISTNSMLYALTAIYIVKAKLNAPIGNMDIR